MKKPSVSDVLEMNIAERILFVEHVWESIATVPKSVDLTKSQCEELDRRIEAYHKDPQTGSSWSDVMKKILKTL